MFYTRNVAGKYCHAGLAFPFVVVVVVAAMLVPFLIRYSALLCATLRYSALLCATLRYSVILCATPPFSRLIYATLRHSTFSVLFFNFCI
jgi:hypothetical protein